MLYTCAWLGIDGGPRVAGLSKHHYHSQYYPMCAQVKLCNKLICCISESHHSFYRTPSGQMLVVCCACTGCHEILNADHS